MNRRGSEPSLAASRCDAAYFDFNFAYPSPPLLLVPPFCAAFPFTIIICFDESGLVCEGGGGEFSRRPSAAHASFRVIVLQPLNMSGIV